MNTADPAAAFAAATSLWEAVHQRAKRAADLDLSASFNGVDELMRVVMRIANAFEEWATAHVAFDELGEVWPYFLGDRFGDAVLEVLKPQAIADFDGQDCLRTAFELRLPIHADTGLPLPVFIDVENPVTGSAFRSLRIQAMRQRAGEQEREPLTWDDDPYDPDYDANYLGLYGVDSAGEVHHIADRTSYKSIREIAVALAPEVDLRPRLVVRRPS